MQLRQIKLFSLLKETFSKWNADNCTRLGASLSYYTLFSLFPLILVALSILRLLLLNSDGARDVILDALASVTGGFREDFVAALDAAVETRRASGIIGTITLLLGASWVFGELVSAFNIIWQVEAPSSGGPLAFMKSTLFSFALVLSGTFLLLVSMIISAVLSILGDFTNALPGGVLVWRTTQIFFNLTVLTAIFALLFKYLPRTYVAWRDVWLGAVLTAILWTMLQSAIAFYIALSSYKDYGAVGSTLALVAWVYLSSQVLFVGGEFTNVYARRYGSRVQTKSLISGTAPVNITAVSSPNITYATSPSRLISGGAGITLGALGMIGLASVALVLGMGRFLRSIFTR